MTCHECQLEIFHRTGKFTTFRTHTEELYFHNRKPDDCWHQFKARHPKLTVKKSHPSAKQVAVL
jgi:hypothetical protein